MCVGVAVSEVPGVTTMCARADGRSIETLVFPQSARSVAGRRHLCFTNSVVLSLIDITVFHNERLKRVLSPTDTVPNIDRRCERVPPAPTNSRLERVSQHTWSSLTIDRNGPFAQSTHSSFADRRLIQLCLTPTHLSHTLSVTVE